ncbi:hypothetical protein VCHA50P415_260005 [Vibrio chagasii]|nr:hypothetical protein VCHA50P415_260005 [Vibrio chagasii]
MWEIKFPYIIQHDVTLNAYQVIFLCITKIKNQSAWAFILKSSQTLIHLFHHQA